MVPALSLADCHFILHLLPLVRVYDGRMAFFHNVLRDLALVHLHLLGEEIHRELLLQNGAALVLLVREDALDGAGLPLGLSARRRDALCRQVVGDPVDRLALYEQTVDFPDRLRLLRHDLWQTVRPFAVTKEGRVRQRDLTIRKTLPLAPCDVFRDGPALLLRETAHDGDQQLAFAVEGVDSLFFKVHLGPVFLQLPDGGEAVHGISGKAAHRLGHNQIDASGQRVLDHSVEALAASGAHGGDALVGIHIHKLPFGIGADVLGVVIYLRLVGGKLLLAIGGHTSISGHPTSGAGVDRQLGVK